MRILMIMVFFKLMIRTVYNLRSKSNTAKQSAPAPPKKTVAPAKQQTQKYQIPNDQQIALKAPSNEVKLSDKTSYSFNFEAEIQKIKIPIPLVELMKNESFKKDILKTLDPKSISSSADILNIQDDKPTIVLGQMIEDRDESCPPFYISLNIHDKILHNCLLDSGASHNLMPKAVMDEIGLEITKTYHDLFSFDSRKVKCLGLIKDLAVTLTQASMKTMVMDVVVADIPPKFGCLLSRSWMKRLGGTLQMDLSYATIPVFGGEIRDYTENHNLPTLSVMNKIQPTILFTQLTQVWDLAYYRLMIHCQIHCCLNNLLFSPQR
jgi:hypothetical protein